MMPLGDHGWGFGFGWLFMIVFWILIILGIVYLIRLTTGGKPGLKFKQIVQNILSPAGITINGSQPWDIQIKNEKFYQRILSDGSLGLGESYMDSWWECENLDKFFCRIIPSQPEDKIKKNWKLLFHILGAAILNRGSKSRAFQIGKRH